MTLLKNICLALVAIGLATILIPIGFVAAIIFLIAKLDGTITIKYFNRVFLYLALSIDIWSNFVMAPLFNIILLKRNSSYYRFGKEGETISSSLGKNLLANNLSKLGMLLNSLLNLFEKNHCIKSIENL